MHILITGAAGNLGSRLARHLLRTTDYRLRLMTHRTPLPEDLRPGGRITAFPCDLADPATLTEACAETEVIVHFAGVLFAPDPERFLPITNTRYAEHLIDAAVRARVRRFILISFPHVEGPTTRAHPCTDRLDGKPISVHAATRLAEERYLFAHADRLETVSLRAGMIYGRDILMIAFARRLARWRLLGVWREPTPIHLLAIDDFLACCAAAIAQPRVAGIYPLGDDDPTTLQTFLDAACAQWRAKRPWRVPLWGVYAVAWVCETVAKLFGAKTPLTKDFLDIGRVPYCCDTSRMKADLLPALRYPSLREGQVLL